MHVSNTIEPDILPREEITEKPKVKKIGLVFWFQLLSFLSGIALLVLVVYWTGFETITAVLRGVGWGILLVIALNGLRHLMRSVCIYYAIHPDHRSINFLDVFAARLVGEAISVVTFSGPFLGDTTATSLLKKKVKLAHSAAAVIVDDILYYLSVLIMILSGVGLLLYLYGSGDNAMQYALIGVTAFTVFIVAGLLLTVILNIRPVSIAVKRLDRKKLLPGFMTRGKQYVYDIENNVFDIVYNRRPVFFTLIALDILINLVSVLEVVFIMQMLGFVSSFSVAYIIESLTKVINLAFTFIPGAVGVYEGGNGVIFHLLGYASAMGVALALVRRGGILFWTFVGLSILLWKSVTRSTKEIAKRTS
jgi:uncharacterized membrane protein YbhN (UPF0104 family)